MKKPRTFRVFSLILVLCAGLVLGACGDNTPTVPGTVPTAYVTTASVTGGSASTAAAPATTAAPATVPVTTAAPTTTAAATLDVSKASATVKDLDFLKGVHDAYLSPNGSLVAAVDPDNKQICTYTIAGQKQPCAQFPQSVDFNSLRWSPDSRYLAYTENFVEFLQDPDIWLMDVATGKSTDLTEDNVTKYQLGEPTPGAAVGLTDQLPVFTADSKHILFLRYPADPPIIPQLFSIDLQGGKPTQIGEFEQSVGPGDTFGYAVSPDGKHIAYAVAMPKAADVKNGLWLGDQTGKNTLQLISSPDLKASRPQIDFAHVVNAEFSGDGNYLSGQLLVSADGPVVYDNDTMVVFTTAGKRVTPIDPETPVHWLAWSPTGSAILALVRDGAANAAKNVKKAGIYLLDKPGGKSVQLVAGDYIPASMGARWRGPLWASNNTALVRRQSDLQLVLVQITTK